jgi:hypothetical protein
VLWRPHRRTKGAVVCPIVVVLFDRVLFGLGPLRLVWIGAIMLGTVLSLRRGLFDHGAIPRLAGK